MEELYTDIFFEEPPRITTEFIVKEPERIVICIMTVRDELSNRLRRYGGFEIEDTGDVRIYKGVAKCAPEDDWDERLGRQLAEYRAMIKRRRDINNEIKKIAKKTCDGINRLLYYGMIKHPHDPRMEDL